MPRCSKLLRALLLAGLWALSSQAWSEALSIVPIRQNLSADHRAASFTLTNDSATDTVIQIRCYSWSQQGNQDRLITTDKLSVSPPFATIPAGKSQTVRLLLRQPAVAAEEAYRIIFDQLPDKTANSINLPLRISVPVFSMAAPGARADLSWRSERQANGQWVLIGANHGQKSAMLANLSAFNAAGIRFKLKGPGMPYMLAGSERRWQLLGQPLSAGSRVHLINPGPIDKWDRWLTLGQNN